MNINQMKWVLQGQTFRQQMMVACEWLAQGYLHKIRVWGYDTLQEAGSYCEIWWDKQEEILTGQYTSGMKSKWVSPFQCHQYVDMNILSESDEVGMTLYTKEDSVDMADKIIVGGDLFDNEPITNR
jgi:hypothetical protein